MQPHQTAERFANVADFAERPQRTSDKAAFETGSDSCGNRLSGYKVIGACRLVKDGGSKLALECTDQVDDDVRGDGSE